MELDHVATHNEATCFTLPLTLRQACHHTCRWATIFSQGPSCGAPAGLPCVIGAQWGLQGQTGRSLQETRVWTGWPREPCPLLAAQEGTQLFHEGSERTHSRLCGCSLCHNVCSVTVLKKLWTVLCLQVINNWWAGSGLWAMAHWPLTETRSLVWLLREWKWELLLGPERLLAWKDFTEMGNNSESYGWGWWHFWFARLDTILCNIRITGNDNDSSFFQRKYKIRNML